MFRSAEAAFLLALEELLIDSGSITLEYAEKETTATQN